MKLKRTHFFFKQLLLFDRQQGFSLIELLTTITILGILAGIAIPSYYIYKKRSYETWLATELTGQSQFLQLGHSTDGGYHQYLESLGYSPQGEIRGNAGFYSGSGTQAPCCDIYGFSSISSTSDTDIAKMQNFTYITQGAVGETAYYMCKNVAGIKESCDTGHLANKLQIRGLVDHGIQNGGGDCNYHSYTSGFATGLTSFCDCEHFTILGVTAYGREVTTERVAKLSDGDGILALNQDGQLCKADPDDNGKLKPL